MKEKKNIKILVMEDNEMYNSLLTKKIELYTKSLSVDSEYTFEIFSYTSLAECMKNLGEDIDIIFLDYYLVRNVTALDILSRIKEKCKDCKVFIISRSRDTEIIHKAFEHGVDDFIFKGKYGLAHSCYLIKRAIADR